MTVLVILGTRPEAIKLAPVVQELRRRQGIRVVVVATGQHQVLARQALGVFGLKPDVALEAARAGSSLAASGASILSAVDGVLGTHQADVVVVQGDTTSALMGGLAAFHRGVPVAHVEAGLRTGSMTSPFPEEMNRRLLSHLASIHFAPTIRAAEALVAEGVSVETVCVTGNTVVDALREIRLSAEYRKGKLPITLKPQERLLLVTVHRRENFGAPLDGICTAVATIAERHGDVQIVIPVHPNPVVRRTINARLGSTAGVSLVEPLDYPSFISLLEASWLVLTDSGGVQEEAPVLGVPVVVLRSNTERQEALDEGVAWLVGTDPEGIVRAVTGLLADPSAYAEAAHEVSPFGDGHAAARVVDALVRRFAARGAAGVRSEAGNAFCG